MSGLCQTPGIGLLRYVTHPEVAIDPESPVERWGLNPIGMTRVRALLEQPWVADVGRLVSSDEVKAVQTAEIIAEHLSLEVEVRAGIGENDRSSTGYLPPEEFDTAVDRFFAQPEASASGWERAVDAQQRVVAGLADLFDASPAVDTVVVGHGGVGTLLYCWLTDRAIARRHDQPGQGHYFTVDTTTRAVLHPWRRIDARSSE